MNVRRASLPETSSVAHVRLQLAAEHGSFQRGWLLYFGGGRHVGPQGFGGSRMRMSYAPEGLDDP